MRPDRLLLAVSLGLLAVSGFVLAQLRNPRSWLSKRLDDGTTLPATS